MGVPLEVQEAVQLHHGDVVVEVAGVEVGVDGDAEHVQLDVRVELAVVVHVPFTKTDLDDEGEFQERRTFW